MDAWISCSQFLRQSPSVKSSQALLKKTYPVRPRTSDHHRRCVRHLPEPRSAFLKRRFGFPLGISRKSALKTIRSSSRRGLMDSSIKTIAVAVRGVGFNARERPPLFQVTPENTCASRKAGGIWSRQRPAHDLLTRPAGDFIAGSIR